MCVCKLMLIYVYVIMCVLLKTTQCNSRPYTMGMDMWEWPVMSTVLSTVVYPHVLSCPFLSCAVL